MAIVFIGIGSNLGERRVNIGKSLEQLIVNAGTILARSELYETNPVGFIARTPFLNMVVKIETALHPSELLDTLLNIERSIGRVRSGKGYQSRVIDLDILFYDSKVIDSDNLIIPHPNIQDRLFVLEPLCDIAADFIHPVMGKTMRELLESLE